MKKLAVAWNGLLAVIYIAVVIGILASAASRFETLVLAGLIQLYAAVLFNVSLLAESADINNRASLVRFNILAARTRALTGDEEEAVLDQEKTLADAIKDYGPKVLIVRFSHGIVSAYALFKIVRAIL